MTKTVYVLNGSDMGLLGSHEPQTRACLADAEPLCRRVAARFGLGIECRHSGHDGTLIDRIHEAGGNAACGIVINPAGDPTSSAAILEAIRAVPIPVVEVHISNIDAQAHFSISRGARAVICGFGTEGYALAIVGLATMVGAGVNS